MRVNHADTEKKLDEFCLTFRVKSFFPLGQLGILPVNFYINKAQVKRV